MSKGLVLLLTSILLHVSVAYSNTPGMINSKNDTRFIITDGYEVSIKKTNEDQEDNQWRIGSLFPFSFGQDFPSQPSFMGITIKNADTTNGTWYYKNKGGTKWVNIKLNNYLVNIDDYLWFVPNTDYYSADPVLLTASLYIVGGEHSNPFTKTEKDYFDSNEGLTLKVFVNPVNDAPTIKLGTDDIYLPVKEYQMLDGRNIANLFEYSFDDSKDNPEPDSFAGVMVTRTTNTVDGIWEFRENKAESWLQFPFVSKTNAIFLSRDAEIRYVSTAPCNSIHNTKPIGKIEVKVYETHVGMPTISGSMHDVSNYDPTGHFSKKEIKLDIQIRCKENPSLTLQNNQSKVYTGEKLYVDPVNTSNIGGKDNLPVIYEYVKDGVRTDHALNAGTYLVTAKTDGNNQNNATQSNTVTFEVKKATPIINFPVIETNTVGSAPFNLNVTTNSNETIVYTSSNNSIAEVSNMGVITLKKANTVTITAISPENDNYVAGTVQRVLNIIKVTPTLSLIENQSTVYTGEPLHVAPVAISNVINNANLAITYKYVKDGVTTDHALGAGVYAVTAEIAGDEEHFSVQSMAINFIVNKAETVINFPTIGPKQIDSKPFSLNVTSEPHFKISYMSGDDNIASVSADGAVTIKNGGSILIYASVDGDNNYQATQVSQQLNIAKRKPILTLQTSASKIYSGSKLYVNPVIVTNTINNADVPITYKYEKDGVISDHALDAGIYKVTAHTLGNDNYSAAESNAIKFVVEKATTTLNFPPIALKQLTSKPFDLNVSSSHNQKMFYKNDNNAVVEIAANGTATIKGSGFVNITAFTNGDKNHTAASASQALTITSDNVSIKLTIDNKKWNISDRYIVEGDDAGNTLDIEIELEKNATISIDPSFTVDVSKPSVINMPFIITSQDGTVTKSYNLTIEKYFSFDKLIVQKWNNTLAINNNPSTNGGYKFVAYKWFKNDIEVSNLGYYSAGSKVNDLLDPIDQYFVELVTDKGEVLHTSKANPVLRNMKVKAYPNPANTGETIYLDADMDNELLENATIDIYNTLGIKVVSTKVQNQITPLSLPKTPGTYILKLSANDFAKELRVIVK